MCTLLANAGDPKSPITDAQLRVFNDAIETLKAAGMRPSTIHVANSAALVLRYDSHFNLVAPGLAIYGLPPVAAVRERVELQPVMTFKTRLMQIKRAPAGSGVGYGHTFVTPRESLIGVLPVGYADGYRRGLQHGGEVIVRGARAPVVGAVSMDLTTIDVTDIARRVGRRRGNLVGRIGRRGDQRERCRAPRADNFVRDALHGGQTSAARDSELEGDEEPTRS